MSLFVALVLSASAVQYVYMDGALAQVYGRSTTKLLPPYLVLLVKETPSMDLVCSKVIYLTEVAHTIKMGRGGISNGGGHNLPPLG